MACGLWLGCQGEKGETETKDMASCCVELFAMESGVEVTIMYRDCTFPPLRQWRDTTRDMQDTLPCSISFEGRRARTTNKNEVTNEKNRKSEDKEEEREAMSKMSISSSSLHLILVESKQSPPFMIVHPTCPSL